ncbi:GNAT family N-acetyltransferase [Dokdonella immobilis]|nr:GNAT family N-acetyltransferase [Dokdonella immobilis]
MISILSSVLRSRPSMNPYRSRQRIPPQPSHSLYREAPGPCASGERVSTDDGQDLLLRPIRPDDAPALMRAFGRMTPEQVRSRVFHALTELPEPVARWMCDVDPDATIALVLVDADGAEIRGEGRVHLDPATECAEFALAVDPDFTGKGLGRLLVSRLAEASRAAGMREIWGDTQAENNRMLALAKELGFTLRRENDDAGLVRMSLALAPMDGSGEATTT